MKTIECSRCGGRDLFVEDAHLVCTFCRSQFSLEADDHPRKETVVDVLSDIQTLLDKCAADPANSYRYASLILDIDPTNREAIKYLR
jgi:hypothetical protein